MSVCGRLLATYGHVLATYGQVLATYGQNQHNSLAPKKQKHLSLAGCGGFGNMQELFAFPAVELSAWNLNKFPLDVA